LSEAEGFLLDSQRCIERNLESLLVPLMKRKKTLPSNKSSGRKKLEENFLISLTVIFLVSFLLSLHDMQLFIINNAAAASPFEKRHQQLSARFHKVSFPFQIPQMILLTFDGAINNNNYEQYMKFLGGRYENPNGCPIRGTFFVSHEYR